MTIYENIREDFKKERLAKSDFVAFYSTLIGEMDNEVSRSKDGSRVVTDEIATKILKSFKKNLEETQSLDKSFNFSSALELDIVNKYLPKQLSHDELERLIAGAKPANVGSWMKYLKDNYAGLYDGKLAKQIFDLATA